MCSIFGAIGNPDMKIMSLIREASKDRGRDGGRMETYFLQDGSTAILGNWRATPTPEIEDASLQPYDGVVHNGTIANDTELGRRAGEVDSEVLPRILDRSSLEAFRDSLNQIVGSYALVVRAKKTLYAACNYRPLHYYKDPGGTIYFASLEHHLDAVVPAGHRAVMLKPYTAIDLTTLQTVEIPRTQEKRAVIIASAGLDSTTVAAQLIKEGWEVCLLHFVYGCAASTKESQLIPTLANELGCEHTIINLPYVEMAHASSLLSSGDAIVEGVSGAEFAHEWVPARNLAMFGVAVAFAEANNYHAIALGNNLEEAGAYPDNEEQMYRLLDRVCDYAVQVGYEMRVLQPCGHLMKHEIVACGLEMGVPYELTWSCYRGGDHHCDHCGPCFMRKEAFKRNKTTDPVFQTERESA